MRSSNVRAGRRASNPSGDGEDANRRDGSEFQQDRQSPDDADQSHGQQESETADCERGGGDRPWTRRCRVHHPGRRSDRVSHHREEQW